MLLLAAVASAVGICSVQVGTDIHRTRCRFAQDEESAVAVPIGRRQFGGDMLDVSLDIVTPGYAILRSLTPDGIRMDGGPLLLERNGACWTGREQRVCLGRAVPRHRRVGHNIPVAYRGSWGVDKAGRDTAHITLDETGVIDDDGRGWIVTAVADDDGVLAVHGRASDDGVTTGEWTVAISSEGNLLLLGSVASLPRQTVVRR